MFNNQAMSANVANLMVAALALVGGAAMADIGKPSPARTTPMQLLRHVLAAEERVPFSGRQTTVVTSGGRAEATITDEVYLGNARSRVTYLMPPTAKGRVVVRDGVRRYTIEPSQQRVIVSDIVHKPVSQATAVAIAGQVAKSYTLSVEPAASRRGPAFVLILTPKQGDRPKRKWWVDSRSGLVYRRETFALDGSLAEVSSYANLQIGGRLPIHVSTPDIPHGFTRVERKADHVVTNIHSARRLDPGARDLPATLGGGFDFQSARIVDAQGTRSLLVQYSDGLTGFSLFKIPGRPKFTSIDGSRSVSIGSVTGTIADSVAPYRVLTWELAGATFNLVSDISEKTMIALARTVRF